jgi:hypothetical protein
MLLHLRIERKICIFMRLENLIFYFWRRMWVEKVWLGLDRAHNTIFKNAWTQQSEHIEARTLRILEYKLSF